MGEYADEAIDDLIFGRGPGRPYRSQWRHTCKRCGATGLKWRCDEDGWRLYENERVEHNRLKRHVCHEVADDFEVLD
jgi:hypothetical protein